MAIKIELGKKEELKSKQALLDNLPRFNLKTKFLGRTVSITYVPVLQTLVKTLTERKGIVTAAKELFDDFEGRKLVVIKKKRARR